MLPKLFPFNAVTGRTTIRVLGCDTVESIIHPNEMKELHIVPMFTGGKSGWIKVLVGVAFIGLAIALGPLGGIAFGKIAGFAVGISSTTMFWLGAGLVLGGLYQTLFPAPIASAGEIDDTKYLGAPHNTVGPGHRIPLLLGECEAYGHFVSYNIDALPE